jgi:outer membrane murein-binding lipoprotein Lpp
VGPRFKNRFVLGAAALATAALAGGAYAATQTGTSSRQAFINDVAHRLNVTPDQLRAALKAAAIDRINQAVKDGRITQAEANLMERRINHGQLPLFFGHHRGIGRGVRRGPLKAAASYLGLTEVQLFDQLRSGKSLADVAKAKGKTTAGLEQAMTAELTTRLDRAVSNGRITKAQEQTILNRFQSRLDEMVNRMPPKFGSRRHLHAIPGGPPPGAPGMFEGPPPPGGPPPAA